METNVNKWTLSCSNMEEAYIRYVATRLPLQVQDINEGFKYHGFFLESK